MQRNTSRERNSTLLSSFLLFGVDACVFVGRLRGLCLAKERATAFAPTPGAHRDRRQVSHENLGTLGDTINSTLFYVLVQSGAATRRCAYSFFSFFLDQIARSILLFERAPPWLADPEWTRCAPMNTRWVGSSIRDRGGSRLCVRSSGGRCRNTGIASARALWRKRGQQRRPRPQAHNVNINQPPIPLPPNTAFPNRSADTRLKVRCGRDVWSQRQQCVFF